LLLNCWPGFGLHDRWWTGNLSLANLIFSFQSINYVYTVKTLKINKHRLPQLSHGISWAFEASHAASFISSLKIMKLTLFYLNLKYLNIKLNKEPC
jgi:hypothetical protein